jgi:enamine deaminase RidA (YjgF/YER057c/UK114 family)
MVPIRSLSLRRPSVFSLWKCARVSSFQGGWGLTAKDEKEDIVATVTHVNPEDMHQNPAFSQGTIIETGRMLIVGGQNGTDAEGKIAGDLYEQSKQALRNVLSVLAAAGAEQADVARLGIYVTGEVDFQAAYQAAREVWGDHPTAITCMKVAGLGHPEALVEIEAVAALK